MKLISQTIIGLCLLGAATVQATATTVQEVGVGANEIVTINSSLLVPYSGQNIQVYAGVLDLLVDGVATNGFCIDPFHLSITGPQAYTTEDLSLAPKPPGPMGTAAATQIEQMWQQFYTPTISNTQAAGLQIAIWETVDKAITGASFNLVSSNDYGASSMLAWVAANGNAPAANLVGLTGPGQDYVVQNVPDGGSTVALVGLGMIGMLAFRKKFLAR